MENAIRDFGKRLQSGDTALFYFSGHGIQVDGMNYLLPIGTKIDSVDEIKYKAVNANMVLDKLEQAGSQVNIIILDVCRNNPFARFRSLQRGLALMASPSGTLIAYATSPGNVAYDGDERNSPYTQHLLNVMKTPGLKLEEVFKQVRVSVMAETDNKQVPWESSSLTGDFYFASGDNTLVEENTLSVSQRVFSFQSYNYPTYFMRHKDNTSDIFPRVGCPVFKDILTPI